MLERLLNLLRAGGGYRIADLARELDTTPALVEAMLEDLAWMGYLRQMGGGAGERACGERCVGCALAGSCVATGGGRVWVLTEKAVSDRR